MSIFKNYLFYVAIVLIIIGTVLMVVFYQSGQETAPVKVSFEKAREISQKIRSTSSPEAIKQIVQENEDKFVEDKDVWRRDNFNTRDMYMVRYYDCLANKDNDPSQYQKAVDYVKDLKHKSDNYKNDFFDYIDRIKQIKWEDRYFNLIANEDYETMCSDDLLSKRCMDTIQGDHQLMVTHCQEICDYVKYAMQNDEFFQNGVLSPKFLYNLSNKKNGDGVEYDTFEFASVSPVVLWRWRIALAHRKTEDKADKICDVWHEKEDVKTACYKKVSFYVNFFKDQQLDCDYWLYTLKNNLQFADGKNTSPTPYGGWEN